MSDSRKLKHRSNSQPKVNGTTRTNGQSSSSGSGIIKKIGNGRYLKNAIAAEREFSSKNNLSISDGTSLSTNPLDIAAAGAATAAEEQNDIWNYGLLVVLYTMQGIPMGLSASIPFLIQQKIKVMSTAIAAAAANSDSSATGAAIGAAASSAALSATSNAAAAKLSYSANAMFALCSWPFSLKLLWAPIVDAMFIRKFGRRKSWLVPVQMMAGMLMVLGANFVQKQLGLGDIDSIAAPIVDQGLQQQATTTTTTAARILTSNPAMNINVKGVTVFFFVLYFLMATQDIAVDGWALTMLSKKNRGRGPVCNSIGQNIGYFISFVGFLALNDAEASENIWRPLLGLKSKEGVGLVSLGGFLRFMGYFMIITTTIVAFAKRDTSSALPSSTKTPVKDHDADDELDASEIGLRETYKRLWGVCQLPSVQHLFVILLTYRFPAALSDNVKFLKAVELGLSKSTTALLSPTIILPLGIMVPIIATKIWGGHPLKQFMAAYKIRVTIVPMLDLLMLHLLREKIKSGLLFWITIIASTAMQAIVNSLQFNAQMTFFASRVDASIGGSYMTLLNTAANLGGTWPSSVIMWTIGTFTPDSQCNPSENAECPEPNDPYTNIQLILSVLGCIWITFFGPDVTRLAALPDSAWVKRVTNDDADHSRTEDVEKASSLSNNAMKIGKKE